MFFYPMTQVYLNKLLADPKMLFGYRKLSAFLTDNDIRVLFIDLPLPLVINFNLDFGPKCSTIQYVCIDQPSSNSLGMYSQMNLADEKLSYPDKLIIRMNNCIISDQGRMIARAFDRINILIVDEADDDILCIGAPFIIGEAEVDLIVAALKVALKIAVEGGA